MDTAKAGPESQVALIRHIAPVVVGGCVTLALTVVTVSWLAARGARPGEALDAVIRGVFAIVGSHLAARLAPAGNPRLRYALALGVLITALYALAASSSWGVVPTWYLLATVALPFPCSIVGGAIAVRAMASRSAVPPPH